MNKLKMIQKFNNNLLIGITLFLSGFTLGRLTFLSNYELTNKSSISFVVFGGIFFLSFFIFLVLKLKLAKES